jgi:two-component system C4-dicarboxylate transport sensor histidine kinase DctB
MEPRIAQSGVMIVRQPSDLELSAWCDANRVQQVLINLLSNALDAVQGGNTRCVEIACNRCGAWAQITVRDHGPGLSDQAQARLFEPFSRPSPRGWAWAWACLCRPRSPRPQAAA